MYITSTIASPRNMEKTVVADIFVAIIATHIILMWQFIFQWRAAHIRLVCPEKLCLNKALPAVPQISSPLSGFLCTHITYDSIFFFLGFFCILFCFVSISCSPCGHFSSHLLCTFGECVLLLMYSVAMAFLFLDRSLAGSSARLFSFHSYCRQAINDACLNLFMYVVLPLNRIISPFSRFTSPVFSVVLSRCFIFCVCACVFGMYVVFFSPFFCRLVSWLWCWRPKKIYTKPNIIAVTTSEGIPNVMRIIRYICTHCCGFFR